MPAQNEIDGEGADAMALAAPLIDRYRQLTGRDASSQVRTALALYADAALLLAQGADSVYKFLSWASDDSGHHAWGDVLSERTIKQAGFTISRDGAVILWVREPRFRQLPLVSFTAAALGGVEDGFTVTVGSITNQTADRDFTLKSLTNEAQRTPVMS